MVAVVLAALLAVAPMEGPSPDTLRPQAVTQTPPAAQAAPDPEAVDLGEVQVTGAPLDRMIRDFVNEVAAPNRGRGMARWDDRICVGVANLRAEPAQYLVDRVSTVAEDLGIQPGEPGCTPNVIIIASDDPDGLARGLTDERRQAFRMGGTGMDRGGDALEDFVASDAPVRWWQVSMPTDSETGNRAVRIPGECREPCLSTMDYAPIINTNAASRLTTQIVDFIFRTIVIVDINQVGPLSGQQLADYVAMVTLAQIDPTADTSRYASILNVFDEPDGATTLTEWDRAYLAGLYSAERNRKNIRAGKSEIADAIHDAHREARAGEESGEE